MNLALIKDELIDKMHHTFGEVTDKIRRYQPNTEEKYIVSAAKYMVVDQFWHLISKHRDACDQYRIIKQYLQQTIEGKYIMLAINNRGQANLQGSKALQRLLKEGRIKVIRDHHKGKMGYGLKSYGNWRTSQFRGWKPYTTAQTYVQWCENDI